jgi:hypothetical protein
MTPALRLYAGAPRTSVVGKPAGPIDPWLGRVVKLVPAEVVAVYLAGRPLAQESYAGVWPLVCMVMVVIVRAWGTMDKRGPQWVSVAISAVSFVLWVYAMGGHFLTYRLDVNLASLGVLVWTTLVPVLWRGEPAA